MTIPVKTEKEYTRHPFLWLYLIVFILSTALFAWIAIRNSQPLECDNIKRYEDKTEVCEILLIKNND